MNDVPLLIIEHHAFIKFLLVKFIYERIVTRDENDHEVDQNCIAWRMSGGGVATAAVGGFERR